tara:strand:- start:302 stop:508 length:207 start_codon:yes stop_codon:yes gene_type:complete
MEMARDDGKRYGAGGVLQEIVEVQEPEPQTKPRSQRRGLRKKAEVLEETVRDSLPSDSEPMEEINEDI